MRKLARFGIAMSLALTLVGASAGCARPAAPASSPVVLPQTQEAHLNALQIPRDGVATATVASSKRADALLVQTDAPASFYRVTTGTDAWFEVEPGARIIAWGTQPGTNVDIFFVPKEGAPFQVVWELQQPLSTPDENTGPGGAGQTYLRQDNKPVGPGWLRVKSRTFDNGDGVLSLATKSSWQ